MKYLFTSERLGFRNWIESDKAPFALINADKEVMEYFPNCLEPEASYKMVERMKKTFMDNGYTFFAVDLLEKKEFIGFIGIIPSNFEADFTPCKEIGWRLKKAVWGKGYATEGAKACLNYGFKQLNFDSIYSITAVINKKSERIMEKLGMVYQGTFEHSKLADESPLKTHVFYKIERIRNEKTHL